MKVNHVVVSAPGKVILHGEHAVVYGKGAIAASIDLRTTVSLEASSELVISLSLKEFNETLRWKVEDVESMASFRTSNLQTKPRGSPSFPVSPSKECMSLIDDLLGSSIGDGGLESVRDAARVFLFLVTSILCENGSLPAISVHVSSNLPIGAGLGSSAAFSISLVTAMLIAAQAIDVPNEKDPSSAIKASCSKVQDSAATSECHALLLDSLQLVCQWAFEAEKLLHGKPSGIDNSISTFGGALHFQNGQIKHLKSMPSLQILLVDTKISRSTRGMVLGLRDRYNKFPIIYMHIFDAIDEISNESIKVFEKLSSLQSDEGETESEITSCFTELESLVDMNQQLLRALGVSHASLDQLCDVTARCGLHSKLTGAGGGGCAITMIAAGTDDYAIAKLIHELTDQLGFQVWHTCLGGQGITVHQYH